LPLRSPRWRWNSGGRFLQDFGKVMPRIFAHLGLGRIAWSYVNYLHKDEDDV
jgi:hypothetical protein